MIDVGDIYLADLGQERRQRVLVLSNSPFNAATGRVIVASELTGELDPLLQPWHIRCDGVVFGLERVSSLRAERLLTRVDRAAYAAVNAARRALRLIT